MMKKLLLILPLLINVAQAEMSSAEVKSVDLKTAYKREYVFLDAQKRELKQRLVNFKSKAKTDERNLLNKISALERGSVSRASKIDRMSTQMNDAENKSMTGMERDEVLQMTYSQAEATLKQYQIDTDMQVNYSKGTDAEKVIFLFERAFELVQNLGQVRTAAGKFFLASGKEVQGDIIQIGNIAAFGVSTEGSGALVPAGGNNLKLWRQPASDTAMALNNNTQPQQLKLFLFESRAKAIEETPEKTVLSVIESGGVIGWIIVGLGGFAVLLIIARIYLLKTNSSDTQKITASIMAQLNAGRIDAAKQVCQTGSCAISRVMAATLRHIKDDRHHMEDIISEAILQESSVLNKFGTSILVIASVSPLLGLLGTVTGMISTFDIITEFGTGDPKLLSGGISIALVTTELGLTVAIPTLLFGSLLSAWSENIKMDMDVAALRITNIMLGATDAAKPAELPAEKGSNEPLFSTVQSA
ncbi:MAG: flagellar motor protein MotA [Methyloprofundus sp.]|nr:flagellar motor protein MotA [Methyloprofundus sp.]